MGDSRTIGRRFRRRRLWAFIALAFASGCAEAPEEAARRAARETLAVLVAHHATDVSPAGDWLTRDGSEAWWMHVASVGSGRWTLSCVEMRPDPDPSLRAEGPRRCTTNATLADGLLSLDAPFLGSTRFHLCRFGTEELLLPESRVRFEPLSDPQPSGVVFERVEMLSGVDGGYLPGPEDEEYGHEGLPR